jgi:hypothetical protein
LGDKEVPSITIGYFFYLTGSSHIRYILKKYDLHNFSLSLIILHPVVEGKVTG